jgi:hypothetical protein
MPKRSNKDPHPQPLSQGRERREKKWLTVKYLPVSLFSLKRSDATSMAARSNLVPTPYTIKMALLKMLLEGQGRLHTEDFDRWIQQEFTWIRDLEIRVQPPEKLIVNRNGYKLRYYDQIADKADKSRSTLPMQDGFVFREWVHLEGHLTICCASNDHTSELRSLFAQINYFGKRGCFFQFLPDEIQETDTSTIEIDPNSSFVIQPMDDLGTKTTFSRINPYSDEKMKLGSDRIIKPGMLPLQLVATSARYDLYKRQ